MSAGDPVAVLEAMKMQHVVTVDHPVTVDQALVSAGAHVRAGDLLAIAHAVDDTGRDSAVADLDPDHIRPDLAEVLDRRYRTTDAARPDAVAKRHRAGRRTARENIDDLIDAGSFVEYGR